MKITLKITTCCTELFAAIILFIEGLFVQAEIVQSAFPAILLFLLSILIFALSTFAAAKIHDFIKMNHFQNKYNFKM